MIDCKTFKHNAKEMHSIADNATWTLARGKNGVLGVGTNGGLSRLDSKTKTFTPPVPSRSFRRGGPPDGSNSWFSPHASPLPVAFIH